MAEITDEMVELRDCPIGLFMSGDGELCLKTEYGNNEGRIDAYIVSSGEFFWGAPPQTIASQRMQKVRPVDGEALAAALSARPASAGVGDSLEQRIRELVDLVNTGDRMATRINGRFVLDADKALAFLRLPARAGSKPEGDG